MYFLICSIASSRGKNAADREEACLHDRVDAVAHSCIAGNVVAVDHVELQLLLDDLGLRLARNMLPDLFRTVRRIQKEDCAGCGRSHDVHPLKEGELVAGHEVRLGDEIGGADRLRSETQVRSRHRTRLLRVVNEVALRVVGSVAADDLDGVLVGAHRAVRTQSVEECAHRARALGREVRIVADAGVRNIVVDADNKVILRLRSLPARRIHP